jgi:hypothetical protein
LAAKIRLTSVKRLLSRFPLLAFTIGVLSRPLNVAQASVIEVDISSLVNADLTTYTGGANYPQHGGPLIVAGVPFTLATIGHNADTAIIQSSTSSGVAETFSIATGVFGVTSAYTLINSAFGTCGVSVGELDFIGTLSTFTYTLIEGVNIRDHFKGNFCNVVTGVAGTAGFGAGADRLDMQQIDLPAVFANETLQRIDFKSFGRGANGSPFLSAVTVATSATPEPPTWNTAVVIGFILLLVKR